MKANRGIYMLFYIVLGIFLAVSGYYLVKDINQTLQDGQFQRDQDFQRMIEEDKAFEQELARRAKEDRILLAKASRISNETGVSKIQALDDLLKTPALDERNEYGFPVGSSVSSIFAHTELSTESRIKTVYLVSPYSHPDKKTMNQREKEITRIAAMLLDKHHVSFFLPITQSAPLARFNKRLKGDFESWREIDLNEVSLRDETWVVLMEGWNRSIGVLAEIKHAKDLGKTLKFINPKTLRFVKEPKIRS